MKNKSQGTAIALALMLAGWRSANGQNQAQAPPRVSMSRSSGGGGGGGGYVSGGERGSVVQVISDRDVAGELNLSDEQRRKIDEILSRVRAVEKEFFDDVHRVHEAEVESMRARSDQTSKEYAEADQQLARATTNILALLTPSQKVRLQAICRQASAGGGFPAGSSSGQGFGRVGGGFAAGGTATGGGGRGGTSTNFWPDRTTRFQSVSGPIPLGGATVQSRSGGGSVSGSAGGGGFGGPGNMTNARHEYQSGGGPGGVVRVISNESVQQQLGLSDQQRLEITEIASQLSAFEAGFNARIKASRPAATTHDWYEQRKQKEESTRRAVTEAGEEMMRQLKPAQQKRLKEICLQAQGSTALFKPEIIQALALTPTQQIKLGNLRQEAQNRSDALFRRDHNTRQAPVLQDSNSIGERLRAIQNDTERRMMTTVLTPAQQNKLEELKGKEFAGLARLRSSDAIAGGGGGGGGTSTGGPWPR